MRAWKRGATVVVSALVAGLAVAVVPGSASAAPAAAVRQLPSGWSLVGSTLVWTSPEPLPLTDAGVQFRSGDRLLGFPARSADGRTYRLEAAAGWTASALGAWSAGRRLDRATTFATAAAEPNPSTAAPKLSTSAIDPGKGGKYATVSGSYTLPPVTLPDLPSPVEMKGRVVAPTGAPGARPLVLFLHGRHAVCYAGKEYGPQEWPCPAGNTPVPSERGYLKAQKLLASQGYVTVSIAANGINGQDGELADGGAQARSSLVRLHLGHWADWAGAGRASAPAAVRAAPPANLRKVLLVGHSRGGEGVNRAALDSLNPPPAAAEGYPGPVRWTIGGTVLIGPTIFGHDPAADVPSVTLLPGCDGDVYDLQGQMYTDGTRVTSTGTALHSAVHVVGANHNYFNSEWTPKLAAAPAEDDWFLASDKLCGTAKKVAKTSKRLTPAKQQQVGAVYTAAAARLFLAGDDRVRPVLDGSPVRPASIRTVRVATSVLGLRRTPFVVPAATTAVKGSGKTTVAVCRQAGAPDGKGLCLPDSLQPAISPNFTPFVYGAADPDRQAVRLRWTAAGGRVAVKAAGVTDLSGSSSLALRLIVPPNSTTTKLDVAVVDTSGKRATLGRLAPVGLPGTSSTVGHWAQELRLPLTAAAKIDLKHVARLELVPRSPSGRAWLVDAWGRKAGTPAVRQAALTRVDVGDLGEQAEGSTTRTLQLPITATGSQPAKLRIWVDDFEAGTLTSKLVTVPAGGKVDVPLTIKGDDLYGDPSAITVYARAGAGTVVGGWTGGVAIEDDDPVPVLSAQAVADDVVEGGTLRWRLSLTGGTEQGFSGTVSFVKPASGTELSTTDVRATWVRDVLGTTPTPSRALSVSDGYYLLDFPAGATSVDVTVPTKTDTVAEGTERVRATVLLNSSEQADVELTGVVRNG